MNVGGGYDWLRSPKEKWLDNLGVLTNSLFPTFLVPVKNRRTESDCCFGALSPFVYHKG